MAKDKGRLPPFVPVFRETLDCPAWKTLSFGARALYIALKARVPKGKNCAYVSYREALKDLGRRSHRKITEWFSELQHYGFIVLEKYGSLGVDGKGKAPLWRLTELGSVATDERPTKDFLQWDGVVFESQDSRPPCPYPPKGKKRHLVVKQVMCTTGGTPKASPLCTTGGTLSDKSAETRGTGVFPTGVQGAPTGGTGFCFPGVHHGGNSSDGDEHQLACRLLSALRGD